MMSEQAAQRGIPPNRSMPPGVVIPEILYDDLDAAVAWLCNAFGFRERLRIGQHRSQLVFGDGPIVAVAGTPSRSGARDSIMVRVENADEHFEQARLSGARILSPPKDYPYGERQYTAEDVSGRRWTFSQSIADTDPATWGGELRDAALNGQLAGRSAVLNVSPTDPGWSARRAAA